MKSAELLTSSVQPRAAEKISTRKKENNYKRVKLEIRGKIRYIQTMVGGGEKKKKFHD